MSSARVDSTGGGSERRPVNPASLVQLYSGGSGGIGGGESRAAPSGGGLLDQMNHWSGAAGGERVDRDRTEQSDQQTTSSGTSASASSAPVRDRKVSKFKLSHNPAALVLGGGRVPDSSAVMASDAPPQSVALHEANGTGETPNPLGGARSGNGTSSGTHAATDPVVTVSTASTVGGGTAAATGKEAKNKSKIADYIIGVSLRGSVS